jgi:hypothetical protein
MSGLEELRKKLVPLFDAEKGFSPGSTLDPSDSYTVSFLHWKRKFEILLKSQIKRKQKGLFKNLKK